MSPLGPPTGKSCSVFVSVPCVRAKLCARVILGAWGRRKTRVLLRLLLLLLLLPAPASRLRPGCVPAASRLHPGCVPAASRLRPACVPQSRLRPS